jgi:hypothetical protein
MFQHTEERKMSVPKAATKPEAKEKTRTRLIVKVFAKKYGLEEASVIPMIVETAFSSVPANDVKASEVLSFMLMAEKYNLDPFMQEIRALPSFGRLVPVVGIDGWHKIINSQVNFGCSQFKYSPETTAIGAVKDCPTWIECEIYRTNYEKPTIVREYLSAVYRDSEYWNSNPQRMLRFRSIIQCGRAAFGLSGIADAEEVLAATPKATPKAAVKSEKALTGGMDAAKKDIAAAGTSKKPATTVENIVPCIELSNTKDNGIELFPKD